MTFLSPSALWLLPLVLIVLLAMRRRPRARESVSGLYLWRGLTPKAARPGWRQFRWDTILAAAFLLTLILALAQPVVFARTGRADVVVDLSASMGARDVIGTRLDTARARINEFVSRLPAGSRVRLLTVTGTVHDSGEFATGDRALRRALAALTPTDGPAALDGAVGALRGSPAVFVFTDQPPPSPTPDNVQWTRVGTPADNLAVTTLIARPRFDDAAQVEVLVGVTNDGSAATRATVDLTLDGAAAGRVVLDLPAHDSRTTTLTITHPGRVVAARLTETDALAADNVRWSIVPATAPMRVLLITAGNPLLERVLAAYAPVHVTVAAPGRDVTPHDWDVVVCDGCTDVPFTSTGAILIPPRTGAGAALAPLALSMPGHALARWLDLGGLTGSALPSLAPANANIIVRAVGSPILAAYRRAGRRVAELDVDLAGSELPLRTAFPILMANALAWTSGRDGTDEISAGEVIDTYVGSAALTFSGPDGRARAARVVDGEVLSADTDTAGVYTLRVGSVDLPIAVNPSTATESDLSHATPDAPADAPKITPALAAWHASTLLIVLALGVLAVEWIDTARKTRQRTFAAAAMRRVHGVRMAVAVLLVLAAAGARLPLGRSPITSIFVLDRSASVSARDQDRALAQVSAWSASAHAGDRSGLVTFGADAVLDRAPTEGPTPASFASAVSSGGTNIAAALRTASVAAGDGPARLVLMSDGRETAGDGLGEAARIAARGIPIDVVALDDRRPARAAIVGVTAPPEARVGEPFNVGVDVVGPPGARLDVDLSRNRQSLSEPSIAIGPDGLGHADVRDISTTRGLLSYRAVASGSDDDREAGAVVSVTGPARVLAVGADDSVLASIAASGTTVTHMTPAALPTSAAALSDYDAVLVNGVPADAFSAAQSTALTDYVRRLGGGLLVSGGPETLTPAAFADGSLAEAMPIDLRPRAGRRAPSMGLVLVFDKSGSMADAPNGVSKIELARGAARRVLQVLPPTDGFGAIAFNQVPAIVEPFAPASNARDLDARLRAVSPGGATAIAPAVALASSWLKDADVSTRRILLISDGRTTTADADRLTTVVRNSGVELSAVAIGADADRELLSRLANMSGGRAYFPDDLQRLPDVAAREAARGSAGAVVDEHFTMRAGRHPMLGDLDRAAPPAMNGYVVSTAKPLAEVVWSSHLGDPVLAVWPYGLGEVAAFTADPDSAWAAPFRQWPAFSAFWRQAVRWIGRSTGRASTAATIDASAGGARLIVDVDPTLALSQFAGVHAAVRLPDGTEQPVTLAPTTSGRYEGALPLAQPGEYVASIDMRDTSGRASERLLRGIYWSADRERGATGADTAYLSRLASLTSGRVLGPGESPFDGPRPGASRDITRLLLLIALLVFAAGATGQFSGAFLRRVVRFKPSSSDALT